MWRRKDSKRHIPSDIGRRYRSASYHDPQDDRAVRRVLPVEMEGSGLTQIGRTRRVNQDQYFFVPLEAGTANCFVGVADGIGGSPGGTEAARFVSDTIQAFVKEETPGLLRPERSEGEIVETLTRGLRRCRSVLQAEVERRPEYSGMGTTLTAALVVWPTLYLVHMGDSRAYLVRNGTIRRMTRDHTYGQALLDAGVLNAETVKTTTWKHVVSNFLTGKLPEEDPEVHPDVHVERLGPGDVLLLCTDGLTDVIPDDELVRTLTGPGSTEDLCRTLLDRARERGARDDTTAVVVRYSDAGTEPGGRRKTRES